MIKDYAVRHFIFKSYIKNVEKDLREISTIIYAQLQNTLLTKEEVIVNNREGLIIRFSKEKYHILIKKGFSMVKCKFEEVTRKQRLDRNEILDFLQFITYETPLQVRLLKKNIFGYVTDKSNIKEYLAYLKKNPGCTFSENYLEVEHDTMVDESPGVTNESLKIERNSSNFDNPMKQNFDNTMKQNFDNPMNRDPSFCNRESIIDTNTINLYPQNNNFSNTGLLPFIPPNQTKIEIPINTFHYQEINNEENNNQENNSEIKDMKKSYKNLDISLEIPSNEIYEIPDFDFKYVNKILRIYSFIYNFCPNKVLINVNVHKLVKSFKETSYISDMMGAIHGFLIENLLEEKKAIGLDNLLTNVKSVIDSITDNLISDEMHIGNEVGMRGWKLKSRMLLLEMYKSTNNKKILSYYNVLNKKSPFEVEDTVKLRISVVEFFINCYMATNLFRDIILNEIKKVKSLEVKAIELSKIFEAHKEENDVALEDINNKLAGIKKKIVLSPAKADIGQLNGAKFFLVNDEIFMSKNGIFYLPSRKTLEVILDKYIPIDKVENNTVNNLRNIIETLYINKL